MKIGIVGLGQRGVLADRAHRYEGISVTHVCDADPAKAVAARERFGAAVRFTSDFDAFLADDTVDAAMVLSPDWLHASQTIALLQRGKAVFLEKPMGITIQECDQILEELERVGGRLFVGHNMRYSPFVLKMKSLLDSGAIGQLQTVWERHFISYGGDAYYKDWHADRRFTTGLLLQKAAHDMDVIQWLAGAYAVRVQGMGRLSVYNRVTDRSEKVEPWGPRWRDENWPPLEARMLNPVIDVEDLSMLHAELSNGVLVAYQQCHYTPDTFRNYTFIGDRGRIESTRDAQHRWVIRVWNRRRDQHNPEGDEQYVIEPPPGGHEGADELMMNDFVGFLCDPEFSPRCSPFDARMAVAVTYQATQSIRSGGMPLEVPGYGRQVANVPH